MKPKYLHPSCPGCYFLGPYREFDLYYCSQESIPTVIARDGDKPWEYSSGLEFGIKGHSKALSSALARAKDKGLYMEKEEKTLLSQPSKNIHLVMGITGHALDEVTWPVRAFRDEQAAHVFAEACQRKAASWSPSEEHRSPPYSWSLLDPKMRIEDVASTHYSVVSIPIFMREDELQDSEEVCPICRGQVYNTALGRVCENDHHEEDFL